MSDDDGPDGFGGPHLYPGNWWLSSLPTLGVLSMVVDHIDLLRGDELVVLRGVRDQHDPHDEPNEGKATVNVENPFPAE